MPYNNPTEFFVEYQQHCGATNVPEEEQASISTFRTAIKTFSEYYPDITLRFARCKGHFQTCEVCTRATDMWKNPKLKEIQRKVIGDVKRLHLKQQAGERLYLETNREAAKQLDPKTGQPKMALLFTDGMTIYTTNTPKLSKTKTKETVKTIESRIIGVEIVCGLINTTFLYFTDDMVSGGAAIMVEVQRQALADLEALLAESGRIMPKKIVFQFDNCGENKVRRRLFVVL